MVKRARLGRNAGAKRAPLLVANAGTPSQPLYTTLWTSYSRSVETNPVPTKAATSFMGFVIGDLLAQRIAGATAVCLKFFITEEHMMLAYASRS